MGVIAPLQDLGGRIDRLDGPWRDAAADIAGACAALGMAFTLRAILLCLRDMPYRRPMRENSAAAALAEWRGTCSAKHLAVHDLLSRLGLAPRLWMARYLVRPAFPACDAALRRALAETAVHDIHNYITCDLGGGEVLIDVTFPLALERHGFAVTRDWNGKGDFTLACVPAERREIASPAAAEGEKRAWLASVNPGLAGELRERVIGAIAALAGRIPAPSGRRAAIEHTLRGLHDCNRLRDAGR